MTILAISDPACWRGLADEVRDRDPEAVLLGGDLVHDGNFDPSQYDVDEAHEARAEHVATFYAFLEAVGANRPVHLVRGNHDVPASGFDRARVEAIDGVEVVEDRTVEVDGVRLAGVGFHGGRRKDAAERAREEADLVLSHVPRGLVPELADGRPTAVVQGHRGVGRFRRGRTLVLLTRKAHLAELELRDGRVVGRLLDEEGSPLATRRTELDALTPLPRARSEGPQVAWRPDPAQASSGGRQRSSSVSSAGQTASSSGGSGSTLR
jgi:predicted phosphodiesterase